MIGWNNIKQNAIWVILAILFFYVVLILSSDVSAILDHFSKIRIEFVPMVLVIILFSHFIKSIRQREFLSILGEKISLKQNIIIYLGGLSLIFTPGGFGVFIKSYFLKQKCGVQSNKSFAMIFLERYHDLLAGTTIILLSLWVSFSWISSTLLIISIILLLVIFLIITNLKIFSSVRNKLSKIKFLADKLPEIESNNSFFILTRPKIMTKGWLISIIGWGVDAFAVYVGFLAFNIDLGYVLTSQIYFTSLGYGILSLIPGGVVVTEGVADYLLVNQGLDLSIASLIVIFTRLSTIWFGTIMGIVFTRFALKQNS